MMSLTLMTITVLLIAALFANTEIQNIENRIDLEVFLNETVTEEKVDLLQEAINNTVAVKEIEYITKDQAVERYKKIYSLGG